MVESLKPKEYDLAMANISTYMSIKEFATSIGISVQAVHKAIKKGRIKDFQRVGYVYLISRKEIKKFAVNQS